METSTSRPRAWNEIAETRQEALNLDKRALRGQVSARKGVGRAQRVDQAATTGQIKPPWLSQRWLSGLWLLPSGAGGSKKQRWSANPPELPPPDTAKSMKSSRVHPFLRNNNTGAMVGKIIMWQPSLGSRVKHGQARVLESATPSVPSGCTVRPLNSDALTVSPLVWARE